MKSIYMGLTCLLFALSAGSAGCKAASKCGKAADQHCSRYSDQELKDIWGGVAEGERRTQCEKEYAANCEHEAKAASGEATDEVVDPNAK